MLLWEAASTTVSQSCRSKSRVELVKKESRVQYPFSAMLDSIVSIKQESILLRSTESVVRCFFVDLGCSNAVVVGVVGVVDVVVEV